MATVEQITMKASAGKALIVLVSSVLTIMGGIYGSAKLALNEANKNSKISIEQSNEYAKSVERFIEEQKAFNLVLLDSISNNTKQTRILTSEVKQVKKELFVIKEAAKEDPQIYAQINYLTRIVEQQNSDIQKKK